MIARGNNHVVCFLRENEPAHDRDFEAHAPFDWLLPENEFTFSVVIAGALKRKLMQFGPDAQPTRLFVRYAARECLRAWADHFIPFTYRSSVLKVCLSNYQSWFGEKEAALDCLDMTRALHLSHTKVSQIADKYCSFAFQHDGRMIGERFALYVRDRFPDLYAEHIANPFSSACVSP